MKEEIRFATPDDCERLLTIYSYYVENTAVSFETAIPTEEDFKGRIVEISKLYPYLVYVEDGKILGFAYASKYAHRAAYCFSVDFSIYIEKGQRGKGIASKLYGCLITILKEQGFVNGYALIEGSNTASIKFHVKWGFTQCGYLEKVGYKFGKWRDLAQLKLEINPHVEHPKDFIPITQLPKEFLQQALKIKEVTHK